MKQNIMTLQAFCWCLLAISVVVMTGCGSSSGTTEPDSSEIANYVDQHPDEYLDEGGLEEDPEASLE